MKKNSFTVITPVYNRADCIGRCIESVVNQYDNQVEHWIVDDGSTDGTYNLIQQYAAQHPFIKHHRFEKNRGVNAARNYAIQNSSGEFILFLDSDDYFLPDALQTIRQTLLEHSGYVHYLFAQDDRMSYYNQNSLLKEENAELTFNDFLTGKVEGDFLHVMLAPLLQSFPFNEYLRTYEGLNFLRIFKAGEKQYFTKKILVARERERTDSVTREYHLYNRNALNRRYISLKETLSLFREDYIRLQAHEDLSSLVKRIFILGCALEKYDENKRLKEDAQQWDIRIPIFLHFLNTLHLGFWLRNATFVYSYLNNKFVAPA